GCGFSDLTPAAQYSGASFAQPLRRVFAMAFAARERVVLPAPGDIRPARFTIELRDLVWDALYEPIVEAIGFVASRLNRFQFLTIRQYLSLVFLALVTLLAVLAIWS
ncbi:MAG: hydrogenase 4 subunit, partial [Tardiphaga sp.]|nr:hydrogenase 4 subunit [Tardiphaga sp.]